MYERLRTEFLVKLVEGNVDNVEQIIQMLDEVSAKYDVNIAETGLVLYNRCEAEKLIKMFVVAKKVEHMSDKTLSRYVYILNNFADKLIRPLNEITSNDIRTYLYFYQKERNVSDRTLASIRNVLLTFFKWLSMEDYIAKNPMERIHPIKFEEKKRHAITQMQLEKLRMACRDDRERCMVEFLYSTGARVSEMCGVKINDINFVTKEVELLGKGNKRRTSFINAKAEIMIQKYLSTRKHDSEYLFCNDRGGEPMKRANVEKIFRRLAAKIGLEHNLTPHVMRHTTATVALQNGMRIEEVQELLGHANVATTMVYTENDKEKVHAQHKCCVI